MGLGGGPLMNAQQAMQLLQVSDSASLVVWSGHRRLSTCMQRTDSAKRISTSAVILPLLSRLQRSRLSGQGRYHQQGDNSSKCRDNNIPIPHKRKLS